MKQRTDSYVFTADPLSAVDMQQIEIVRKTVAASNKLARLNYKWACQRAELMAETVPRSLHHSCRSELTRQGISLP